ncbi:MAG: DUF1801 domain-containing protein [Enterococcus sp.]
METVKDYEAQIKPEWCESYFKMKAVFMQHLPNGFELQLQYGMPTFVVPLVDFPEGYLARQEALPFVSIGVQKNYLSVYHLGIMANPSLLAWFQASYAQVVPTKLNMGKSCIRFTNPKKIPYELMGELAEKMSVAEWIALYQKRESLK